MHMIIINNAMCNTAHMHTSSLTHSKHSHPQDYEVIELVKFRENLLYL